MKKFVIVVMAAGTFVLMELFGSEDMPHTHVELEEPESNADVFPTGHDEKSGIYTLALVPTILQSALFHAIDTSDRAKNLESITKVARLTNTPEIPLTRWDSSKHQPYPMLTGRETDIEKLKSDLQTILLLSPKQIETIIAVLAAGHEIAIGAEQAPVFVPPAEPPNTLAPTLAVAIDHTKPSNAEKPVAQLPQTLEDIAALEKLIANLNANPDKPAFADVPNAFSIGAPFIPFHQDQPPLPWLSTFTFKQLERFGMNERNVWTNTPF